MEEEKVNALDRSLPSELRRGDDPGRGRAAARARGGGVG